MNNIDLPRIEGGEIGLVPLFRIGPFSISSEGFKTEVVDFVDDRSELNRFSKGSIVCVYLLHFGSFIKIGTSGLHNVVARMIAQVPFLGVVAAVIELREDFEYESESIERRALRIARDLRFKILKGRRCKLKDLVKLWESPPRGFIEQLEKVEAEHDPLIVNGMREATKIAVDAAKEHGFLLFKPATFWFTTERKGTTNVTLPTPLAQDAAKALSKGQDVLIKAYPNGMLGLQTTWAQKNLTEDDERICTLYDIRKVLFKVRL